MEIIAAPADSEYLQEPKSLEEFAFSAGELSQIAAKLLRQMLELYGESVFTQEAMDQHNALANALVPLC